MENRVRFVVVSLVFAGFPLQAMAGIDLKTAGNFAILAGSAATNTGPSVINGGDVGISQGTTLTGFSSGTIAAPYTTHLADAVAIQAQNDLATAYNAAASLIPTHDLTGQNLGGMVLTPGVYCFASSAQLTGILTLNDLGNPNAQFVFQIGSTLTTASSASVVTINGGSMTDVYWQVGSSASLGTGTAFEGHLLALTSITLTTGATLKDGSALALDGSVTLDTNAIINGTAVPEPGSLLLGVIGGSLVGLPVLSKRMHK